MSTSTFYSADQEPATLPLYSYAEAARILGIPPTTLRYWLKGGVVTNETGSGHFARVLEPDADRGVSFANLLELRILKALRHRHGVPLQQIRLAHEYASHEMGLSNPLLTELLVGGRDIFVREMGSLVSLTRSGQLAIRGLLDDVLSRVELGPKRLPVRYYPLVSPSHDRRLVQLDPVIRFGAPTISGTAITTSVVASRFDAGEEAPEIAEDYDLPVLAIEDAVIYEARVSL